MARQLFGTDGVRGVAGELLTAELAMALGRAATLQSEADAPRVLVIRDTRESGEMLEAALAAGISAAGGDVLLGGVLPTPGAPLLLHRYGFDLAAVISASHNPYRDNGIKFFAADGFKLSDEIEASIEARLEEPVAPSTSIGRIRALHGCGRCTSASPTSNSPASTSPWTAPTAPPTASPPRSSAASAPP